MPTIDIDLINQHPCPTRWAPDGQRHTWEDEQQRRFIMFGPPLRARNGRVLEYQPKEYDERYGNWKAKKVAQYSPGACRPPKAVQKLIKKRPDLAHLCTSGYRLADQLLYACEAPAIPELDKWLQTALLYEYTRRSFWNADFSRQVTHWTYMTGDWTEVKAIALEEGKWLRLQTSKTGNRYIAHKGERLYFELKR
jgi:hypothetical protein